MRRICVFCGSSIGARPVFANVARRMGETVAKRGLILVYGGSKLGLMGAVADAALAAGGQVIGVIPDFLKTNEVAHDALTELRVVGSMHERKARMADMADAFVALPGGIGTFEEYCEIVTWAQLGLHVKPCGLLNVDGYYDPLLALIDRAVAEGFIRPEQRGLVLASADVDDLFEQFDRYTPPVFTTKWIDRSQT